MIKILHISDLHFYDDAQTYNMQDILISEARQAVRGLKRGQKLLVVTGDFHNFKENNYNMAESFLNRLILAMDLDRTKDVFVVPGNHDVGNDDAQRAVGIGPDKTKEYALKIINGDMGYVEKRLEAYIPYCSFVRRMGFYPDSDDELYPARVHVRQWQGIRKLNILHLNTTLTAIGSPDKDGQRVDVTKVSDPKTWDGFIQNGVPAIALGHNHYWDVEEKQRMQLESSFSTHNINAYLCGDTHRLEIEPRNQVVFLSYGPKQGRLEIPNLVCAKSIGDMEDNYSDFGYYLHEWDEKTGIVNAYFRRWRPEYRSETKYDESADGFYHMFPLPSVSESDTDSLKQYLDNCLLAVRKNHPSFRLMNYDDIDRRLLPGIKEKDIYDVSEALAKESDNAPASPVWRLIRSYWNTSQKRNIIIQGAGGIGKTVTLLSITSSLNAILHPPAVYIPLHSLVTKDGKCLDIPDYLKKQYPEYHKEIGMLAACGWDNGPKLLLLLDGFNEVPVLLRSEILDNIIDWDNAHPGVQLIAVSRPTTGISLKELSGDPVKVTLEPLTQKTVCSYLKDWGIVAPQTSSAIWKELRYPLFLTLYVKTDKLKNLKSNGYSLAPKQAESGGALIWNFLQRELLRINSEKWVIRCALACEYVIPYIAYRMAKNQCFTVTSQEAKEHVAEAINCMDINIFPRHLRHLFQAYYDRYFEYPDLDKINWNQTVLQDAGILVSGGETGTFTFMHQNFRDCLAGLYLVNQAEMTETINDYPAIWQESHHPDLTKYASELMDRETFTNLWGKNRGLQPTHHTGTINLLETRKHRDDWGDLDFSGMDLSGLSLARFMGESQYDLGLFRHPGLAVRTRMNKATFIPQGHRSSISCIAVTPDGLCISGSLDGDLRVWDSYTGEILHIINGPGRDVEHIAVTSDGLCVSGFGFDTLRVWDSHTGKRLFDLIGHSMITCVAVTPDGLCINGSWDGNLRVWDLHTGEYLQALKGHSSGVTCVAVTPDGLCVSGSKDKTLRVWNLHTGECLHVLEGHDADVSCVTVTPDGLCVSGSMDNKGKTLRVWNLHTGECLHVLEGHRGEVKCISVIPDGLCVSGSKDKTLRVWNLHTGECLHVLNGHKSDVECIAVTLDGLCVSGSKDKTLRVWNLHTGECLHVLEGHDADVSCVAVTPDGLFASGSKDCDLRVWNVHTGECIYVIKGHRTYVSCTVVGTTQDGLCINGFGDGTLRVWNPHTGECLHVLEGHGAAISCVAVTPDGLCVSGAEDGTLRVWNIHTGECLHVLEGHKYAVLFVAVMPDGLCISGSGDNCLWVWNLYTGERVRIYKIQSCYYITCIAVTPDGLCVCGCADGIIRALNIHTGVCLRFPKGHRGNVECIAVTPDELCVSGFKDGILRAWDVHTGKFLNESKGHSAGVSCVAVTSEGLCFSGACDGTLRVWNPHMGKCLNYSKGNNAVVSCIAVTSDDLCVSGFDDGTLRVWNAYTGEFLDIFKGYRTAVSCVAVTPDGLCIGGFDNGILRAWNVHTGERVSTLEKLNLNNIQSMDFSKAQLDAELRMILRANGATVGRKNKK